MLREYGVDLLDFYRGTLSARRLGVLVRNLSLKSSLVRARNGGVPPWTRLEHLVADLWALWAKQDHPKRAEMEAKARNARKLEKHNRMRAKYRNALSTNDGGGSAGEE